MRDLEALIKEWEVAADNDGPPPDITEEERQALARKYLEVQGERRKIRGFPFLGMSESQHVKAGTLDQQMGVVGNFIRESLMKDGRVSDAAAIAYINQFAQEK